MTITKVQRGFIGVIILVVMVVTITYNADKPLAVVQTAMEVKRIVFGRPDIVTKCLPNRKKELMASPLAVNEEGNVDLNNIENSTCFLVNSSETGIHRVLIASNFEDVKCAPVQKRYLNVTIKEDVKTALYSIPGSGNTWTRHLVEEITGIYTGSIYRNQQLKPTFDGEDTTHRVSVIKTHKPEFGKYDRAVVIVRDPFESTRAEFNRRLAGQIHFPGEKRFNAKGFDRFFESSLNKNPVVRWIEDFEGDIFILYYDKLITDLPNSLIKLATFLKYKLTLERLWCTVVNKEGSYRRKGRRPDFMSRKVLVNDMTEEKIKHWKLDIQTALKRRSLYWSSN